MPTCPACGRANPAEASFCMGCASPLGTSVTAHEVRKTVTALFCDLVGSTSLGERHDPEVLRPLLERYFAAAREAVERHGGRVEKFIGDAVAAVFGLPIAHEDDALRAVRAGVEMQERLVSLTEGAPIPLAARVGITTGEVLVPGGGAPLIGDAMNTAARLQSSAEPGSVVIGEPTFRLVRDAVVAEPVAPVAAKGKAQPVTAYRVLRVASHSPTRTRRLDSPMVGRARESALLATAFERVASDRTCELFTVLGVAGAGKSRLVEEFLGSLGSDVTVLRGRCLSYGEGITYLPVTEALREALAIPEFAEVEAVRGAIRAAVADEEHAAALEANLAPLFAAGASGTPDETAWAIRRFLESRAHECPLVLVLDDIHWGEATFLDLVEHLADWSRDASILLLCMARPDLLDVRPAWGGGKTNATTISLAPLSAAETDTLIDGLLDSTSLPEALRLRVGAVAEGNPLFVEEVLRMLVDEGRLVRDGAGGWSTAGELAAVPIPPTVAALVSARIDRLSEGERAVLEAASVEGPSFHRGAVAALAPEAARHDLAMHLRSLVRKELISPERSTLPGEDAYRFRHLIIRDAAYDAIPKASRSIIHEAFADWLEGVAGDRIAESQELLGYHLERAFRYRDEIGLPEDRGLRLRAAGALGRAGALALDRGDIRGAIDLLRGGADRGTGDPVELDALSDLASALYWAGRHAEGAEAAARLAAAAGLHGSPAFAARARVLGFAYSIMSDPASIDPRAARELIGDALRIYREHASARFEPEALLWLSNIAWSDGDSAGCLRHARLALDVAMDLGLRSSASWAVNNILSSLELGPTPLMAAIAQTDGFLERFAGERWVEVIGLNERAYLNALLGRTDAARADAEAGRSLAEAVGLGGSSILAPVTFGLIAWDEEDPARAVDRLQEAISAWEAVGDRLNPGAVAPIVARALIELGRDTDAEAELRRLEGAWSRPERASLLSLRGRMAATRGLLDEAMLLAEEALRMARATDFAMLRGDVALDRAEVCLLAGRPDEARAAAMDALATFRHKEYVIGVRRARSLLARLDQRSPSRQPT